jgi:hypothetical protein
VNEAAAGSIGKPGTEQGPKHDQLPVTGCTVFCKGAGPHPSCIVGLGPWPVPLVLKENVMLVVKLVCIALPVVAGTVMYCPSAVADLRPAARRSGPCGLSFF